MHLNWRSLTNGIFPRIVSDDANRELAVLYLRAKQFTYHRIAKLARRGGRSQGGDTP